MSISGDNSQMNGRYFSTLLGMVMILGSLFLNHQASLKSMAMDPIMFLWLLLLGGLALQVAALHHSMVCPEARRIERWIIASCTLLSLAIAAHEVI